MKFLISNKNNYCLNKKILKNFKKICLEVEKKLKINNKNFFEVIFVSKYIIKKINKNYRNQNKITDVISFSYLNASYNQNLLGEIFICYDQCLKQSKSYGNTIEREISFMFLHGLLHLLNYDHQNKKEEKIMFDIQDYILEKLKI